jgi:hypothetical protein
MIYPIPDLSFLVFWSLVERGKRSPAQQAGIDRCEGAPGICSAL